MSDHGELLAQGEAFDDLLRRARCGRAPHALLLCGAPGTGKTTAARVLIQALLCSAETDGACGVCTACVKVAAGNHPDVHYLQPPEDKRDIPVDAVRELQGVLERSAVEGRARVACIDPADTLNEQGQNALLKTLEEPHPGTFLLLVTSRPEGLLETVRSRVQRMVVRPLDESAISERLAAENLGQNETRTWAARAAGGSLGRARWLLGQEAKSILDLVVPFVRGNDTLGALALARKLSEGVTGPAEKRRRAASVLVVLRALHRAALPGVHSSLEHGDGRVYSPQQVDPWCARSEWLFDAEEDLGLQIPPEQVLTGLFLLWQGVRA